jgi:hypothetical protein
MSFVRSQRFLRAAKFAVAVLAFGGGIAAVSNDADAFSARVRRACAGDYHRLCPSYKIDTPQLRTCMEANGILISSPCISALVDSGEIDGSRVKKRQLTNN